MAMKNKNLNSLIVLLLIMTISVFLFQNYLAETITGFPVCDVSLTVTVPNNLLNESVTVTNTTPVVIDTKLNITVSISANATMTGFINITSSVSNPASVGLSGKQALNKFIIANTNISFVNITLYVNYTDSEVADLNLIESGLRLYHFNTATDEWDLLPGGVDTGANYVHGITASFSTFGIFGSPPAAAALAPAFLFGGGHEASQGEKPPAAKAPQEKALFDLAVQIVPPYEYAIPGEFFLVVVQIINFGTPGIKDVALTYSIINGKEETIVLKEKLPVETSGEVARRIAIPYDMAYGKYKLRVVAEYGPFITTSYTQFTVVPKFGGPTARFFMYAGQNALLASIAVLVTALLAMIIYVYSHLKKHEQKEKSREANMANYMRAYFDYMMRGKQK